MSDIISGKDGNVQFGATPVTEPNVAYWSIDRKVAINAHASNSTSGEKTRSAGVGDSTGEIHIYQVDDAAPSIAPGNAYDAVLDLDGGGTNKYTGSIMIEEFTGMGVDMNDGKEIVYKYKWGQNGALTAAGNAAPLS